MSDIIYIKENDNQDITISKTELERIMKEKYSSGFADGLNAANEMIKMIGRKENSYTFDI